MTLNELIYISRKLGINFDAPLVIYEEGLEYSTFKTLVDTLPINLEEDQQFPTETFNYSRYESPVFKKVQDPSNKSFKAYELIFAGIMFHKNQDRNNLKIAS